MTFGLVEPGEIIGIFAAWQIGAPSSERLEATSPSTATTWSLAISLRTQVPLSPGFDSVSSVISSSFVPSTPPASLMSSIAMTVPWWEEVPRLASLPVKQAYSPTGIVVCAVAERAAAAARDMRVRERRIMVGCRPEKGTARHVTTELPGMSFRCFSRAA